MSDFGVLLLVIAVLAILIVGIFSISYLKTALIDLKMKKLGFFLGSAGICAASIILLVVMAGAFLGLTAQAENAESVEVPETTAPTTAPIEETAENSQAEPEPEPEPETQAQAPAAPTTPTTSITPTTPTTPTAPTTAVQTTPTVAQSAILPKFEVWRGYYKDFSYTFIEVENGVPYVYMPSARSNFQTDLNNIKANREGGNIVIMANASLYNTTTTEPLGTTIQNGKIVAENGGAKWTLVVDDGGNVGYIKGSVGGTTADYIDAKTGATVKNRKIVSAAYAFAPIMLNGEATGYYKTDDYRARQIFCVKNNSYIIITNTGEGASGGGWNTDDMVQVAKFRGCLSAFNLDGGGSTATAYRYSLGANFSVLSTTLRHDPTFIVFTSDNLPPRGK